MNNYELLSSNTDIYQRILNETPVTNNNSNSSAGEMGEIFQRTSAFKKYDKDNLPTIQPKLKKVYRKYAADNSIYKGEILNERRHGQGELIYQNLKSYTGSFFNDLPDGVGEYYDGECHYRGDFKEGVMTYGSASYMNELIYTGSFATDTDETEGTVYLPGDLEYSGKFLKGNAHGEGTLSCTLSLVKFTGTYVNGCAMSNGKLTFPNGSVYEGEVNVKPKMPFPEGNGKLTYLNGETFEGTFEDGLPQIGVLSRKGIQEPGRFSYDVLFDDIEQLVKIDFHEVGKTIAYRLDRFIEGDFYKDTKREPGDLDLPENNKRQKT